MERIRIWFTLFFVPVIPYDTEYWVLCSDCECGFKLSYEEYEQLKEEIARRRGFSRHEYQVLEDAEWTVQDRPDAGPEHSSQEIAIHLRAVEESPANAEHYFNLGCAYGEAGRNVEAAQAYTTAIRLDPGYADAHYNLGVALEELGRADEAVASYKQAIRLAPDDPDPHFALGMRYASAGDADRALAEYKILQGLESGKAKLLFDAIYT